MTFQLKVLQAGHGDSIAIKIEHEGQLKNILIDGGPASAFVTGNQPMAIKEYLDETVEAGEFIDLLVLTHIDDDHVGGLLAGFEDSDYLAKMTKKIWFNSGRLIFEYFKCQFIKENAQYQEFEPDTSEEKKTSVSQGIEFEKFIQELGTWQRELIKVDQTRKILGCTFTILSPTDAKLNKLLYKWEKESEELLTSPRENDYSYSIDELITNDKFRGDQSIHNGSSIAFLLSYKDASILFLGDAHASVIIKSLKDLGYSKENKLKLSYVKVSHHGSKANTNKQLLELLDCNNFIISTDGTMHNLPNKVTLARIVNEFPYAILLFNYPDLIEKIFTKQELENVNFSVSSIEGSISL